MELIPTELSDVLSVRPTARMDSRGMVRFAWNLDSWRAAGLPDFVLENHIVSKQWVLRGIHLQVQTPQGKLVRCLAGSVFDVAVDLRKGSPHFGQWVGRELHATSGEALWIPPGFGHGFLSLVESAAISIQATCAAVPMGEHTLHWRDPDVAIEWPIPAGISPVTNERDAGGDPLRRFNAV